MAAPRQTLVVCHAEVTELLAAKEANATGNALLARAAPAALFAILVELALRAKRVRAILLHHFRHLLFILGHVRGCRLEHGSGSDSLAARLAQRHPLVLQRHRWRLHEVAHANLCNRMHLIYH